MSGRMVGKVEGIAPPEIAFISVQGKHKKHLFIAADLYGFCKDQNGNVVQPQVGDEVEFKPFGAGWAGEVVLLRTSQQIADAEKSLRGQFAGKIPGLDILDVKAIALKK